MDAAALLEFSKQHLISGSRYDMVAKEYQNPDRMLAHYREWNDLVSTYSKNHFVVCNDQQPAVALSVEDWERRVG